MDFYDKPMFGRISSICYMDMTYIFQNSVIISQEDFGSIYTHQFVVIEKKLLLRFDKKKSF